MLGAEVPLAWRLVAFALLRRLRDAPRTTAAGVLCAGLLVLGGDAIPTAMAAHSFTLTVVGPAEATSFDEAHIIVETGGSPVASADVGASLGQTASFRLRRGDYTVLAYALRAGSIGSAIGAPVFVILQRDREIKLSRGL